LPCPLHTGSVCSIARTVHRFRSYVRRPRLYKFVESYDRFAGSGFNSTSLLAERKDVSIGISSTSIRERIRSESEGQAASDLGIQLKAVQRQLVAFQERLVSAHPELLLRVRPAQPLTPASINTLFPANDFAYLEYVVSRDTVGMFILTRNDVPNEYVLQYIDLRINADELRQKVKEFHSALAERHPGYETLGRELYRLLIEPAANELRSIEAMCIIPDAFLWTLPFQALKTTRGNYLIQQHSLFYGPSLSVLIEMSLRGRQQNSRQSLIAFGNPVIARNEKLNEVLPPLPEAKQKWSQ
jgi:CHAT domain-containing protein